MPDTLPPIIYVSNASWFYGLPTNRQQLPKWLAEHTRVLYSSPFSLSQAATGKIRFNEYKAGIQEMAPNLYLFHNVQLLPLVRAQLQPFQRFDQWLTTRALRRHAAALGFDKPILWLYFPPTFEHLIGQLGESLTCYHCTDDHAGYAEMLGLDRQRVAQEETRLVEAVDIVFTTSRPLYEQKVRHNPHTYLMPNVADVNLFGPVARGAVPPAPELAALPGPIVGFIGAIDSYKVNLDLLAEVARLLPTWSFVLVGPVGLGDHTQAGGLPDTPNLHFLGPRAYTSLPAYVAAFDICVIPYQINSYTVGVFPLKFWEYLAAGKPVVTTPLPSLSDYYQYVHVAAGPSDFVEALQRALASEKDATAIQQRLTLADGHSWKARAAEMARVLASSLGKQ